MADNANLIDTTNNRPNGLRSVASMFSLVGLFWALLTLVILIGIGIWGIADAKFLIQVKEFFHKPDNSGVLESFLGAFGLGGIARTFYDNVLTNSTLTVVVFITIGVVCAIVGFIVNHAIYHSITNNRSHIPLGIVFLIISAITFNIPDVIASILYILSFSFNKKNLDTVETIVSKQLDFSMNQTTRARVIGKWISFAWLIFSVLLTLVVFVFAFAGMGQNAIGNFRFGNKTTLEIFNDWDKNGLFGGPVKFNNPTSLGIFLIFITLVYLATSIVYTRIFFKVAYDNSRHVPLFCVALLAAIVQPLNFVSALIVLLTQYKLVKTNEVIPTIDIFDESGNKNPKLEDPLQAVPYEEININHGAVDAILNRPATDLDRIVDDYVSDLDLNKKSTVKVPTDGDGSGRNSNITINISGYGHDGADKTSTTNNTTTHHIHHNDEETTIKRSVSATKKIVADANEEEINNEPKRVIHAKKHEYVDDLTISDNEEEKVEEEVAPVGPTIIQQTHTHDEHLAKIPASSEITSFKSERKFNQLLMPTPRIAPIVGSEPLTRAEAIKRVWEHIHAKDLHDKVHKKIIHVDDQLGRFIPVDHVTMFELAKYVNKQLLSDTSVDLEALNNNTKKKGSKKRVRDEIVETQEVVEREKPREFMDFSSRRQFNPLYLPSPELAAFLKVDEPVTRPFVIKKIWAHIKRNNLTDKVNKKVIHIDEILRPIFPVETIGMFEMPKYLSKHLARKGKVEV